MIACGFNIRVIPWIDRRMKEGGGCYNWSEPEVFSWLLCDDESESGCEGVSGIFFGSKREDKGVLIIYLIISIVVDKKRTIFGFFLTHEWSLCVGNPNVCSFSRNPCKSACSHFNHILHPAPFVLGLLLHVPSRFIDPPIENKENYKGGPVVADDKCRIEYRILEELNCTFSWLQIPIS